MGSRTGPWRPHEIVGVDGKQINLDDCWRCPLKKRKPGRATQRDPMWPDKVLVCVPCASDRSNHPHRPAAPAAA